MARTDLAVFIRGFFEQHLVSQRGLSGHTILAYRDPMKLLLEFASRHYGKVCTKLTLEDLTADMVRRFLNYLEQVRKYLQRRSVRFTDAVPLFVNVEGNRLTCFGLRYIIAHRVAEVAKTSPTLLTRRVTPHTIRHTTAMHLLQFNVDLNMIRSWLGHASIETTHGYVEIDLEMKRKALQSCEKLLPDKARHSPSWKRNNDILSWLSKL
jgi:site-specific recombinase XerD